MNYVDAVIRHAGPSSEQATVEDFLLLRGRSFLCCLGFSLVLIFFSQAKAGMAQAQDDAPAATAPPAAFEPRIPTDQLKFLADYAGRKTKEIRKDKRFKDVMKEVTPRTTYHYGRDMALTDTIGTMLDGPDAPVEMRDERYVMVTSGGGPYLGGRGMIWFDRQEGIAIGAVYFHPTNGEPTPTLAIFSRQLSAKTLGMSQLPEEFRRDLNMWSLSARVPAICVWYFIPENGKKYPLLHDEDYCAVTGAAQAQCQRLNADAADADLSAASFMHQTGKAANATAWMLSPEQTAWFGLRERTCGVNLGCRVVFTRRRVRALVGR